MDHFKRDTEQEKLIEAILVKFACEQGQSSTQALSRRRKSMHRGGVKYGKSRRCSLLKSVVHLIKIGLDISQNAAQCGRVLHQKNLLSLSSSTLPAFISHTYTS